jgi:hypothetical protein
MILDVPSHKDFIAEARVLLNLAWEELRDIAEKIDYVLGRRDELVLRLDFLEERNEVRRNAEEDEFYRQKQEDELLRAIQRPLGICRTLIAQSAEYYLKAKIAEVSPYILIKDEHSKWPGRDQRFADYRTIDASDLVRVCRSTLADPPSDEFVMLFEELRTVRNFYTHGIAPAPSLTLKDACDEPMRLILAIADFLDSEGWIPTRKWYLNNYSPGQILSHYDYAHEELVTDVLWLLERLTPTECRRFLYFDRKVGRNYLCLDCCAGEYDTHPDARFVKVNGEQGYCFVCQRHFPLLLRDCEQPDCKGSVSSVEKTCLSCGG